jgi:hypothetical protein
MTVSFDIFQNSAKQGFTLGSPRSILLDQTIDLVTVITDPIGVKMNPWHTLVVNAAGTDLYVY